MPPKKAKEQTFDLSTFASLNGDQNASWADEEESSFHIPAKNSFTTNPSSGWGRPSDASQGGWQSGNESVPVPDHPPFTARIGNVSYNITEQILEDFFRNQQQLKVLSVRLPRSADGQVRGSAYIDFEDKESLVKALTLGGSTILERKVSVQVAEQRNNFGGSGGGDFDWGRRAPPGEGFGSRPDLGRNNQPGQGDRLERFRRAAPGPELDWSARSAPPSATNGAPKFREPAARTFREPEPALDWGARRAPPAASKPVVNRAPKEREPEPEFDWTKKKTVVPKPIKPVAKDLDWSKKKEEPVSRPDDALKKKQQRIADMTKGFKALQLDDDEEDDEIEVKKVAAGSIGEIQKAQREATSGGWSKA